MMRSRIRFLKSRNPVKIICIFGSSSFIIIQILMMIQFNEVPLPEGTFSSPKLKSTKISLSRDAKIGKFGEWMINMLPEDLAFTLFMPSEKGFEQDLRLNPNDSLIGEMENNMFAILTRVLGFSAVPRWIYAANLEEGMETTFTSISGFDLYMSKDSNGIIVVNGVASEKVDLRMGKRGNTLVHVMDGVLMDVEFEESIQPDDVE